MAYSKATMKAVDKYVKANYDRIEIKVPKGRKATVEAMARSSGESVNGFVNNLLMKAADMTEENWKNGKSDGD